MSQYFRITAYYPKEDISFIMDCYGKFEKLWQFSAFIVQHGCKVLEVGTDDKFLDINITKAEMDTKHIMIRASCKGKPTYLDKSINGVAYKAIQVSDKCYIPEK